MNYLKKIYNSGINAFSNKDVPKTPRCSLDCDKSFDNLSIDSKYFAKHLGYPGKLQNSNDPRYPGHVFNSTSTTNPWVGCGGGFSGVDFARKADWRPGKVDKELDKDHKCGLGGSACKKVRRSVLSKRAGTSGGGLAQMLGWRGMADHHTQPPGPSAPIPTSNQLASPSAMSVDLEIIRNRAIGLDGGYNESNNPEGLMARQTGHDMVYGERYGSRPGQVSDGGCCPPRYEFQDPGEPRHGRRHVSLDSRPKYMSNHKLPNGRLQQRENSLGGRMSSPARRGTTCFLADMFQGNDTELLDSTRQDDVTDAGSCFNGLIESSSEYDSDEEHEQYGRADGHVGVALATVFINPFLGIPALLASYMTTRFNDSKVSQRRARNWSRLSILLSLCGVCCWLAYVIYTVLRHPLIGRQYTWFLMNPLGS